MISTSATGQATPTSSNRFGPRDLWIEIIDSSAAKTPNDASKNLIQACNTFSIYLTKNRGLWASGPFARATCNIEPPQKQDSQGAKADENPATRWSWKLRIEVIDSRKKFEIFYRSKNQKPMTQALYELDTEISLQPLLEKHDFAQLIAAYLTNRLPIRTAITGSRIALGKTISVRGKGASAIQPASQTVQIYGVKRSTDLWLPTLVASGELSFKPPNQTSVAIKNIEMNPLDGKVLANRKTIYFMHQIADKEINAKKIDDLLRSRMGSFFSKFLDIGRSAYVGVRYGAPLTKGQGVLARSNLIGLFGEFRGGILSGLRLNYDMIPTQRSSTEENSDEFSWSRLQLGYSLGIRLDNQVINWIDISPKIGVTNLILRSTPTETGTTEGYEFRLQRAPTVGIEIGLEKRTNKFLVRLWGYGSYSLGVLPIDKEYKSTSLRGGLDMYRELIDWKSIKVAGLIFASMDSNQYTRVISVDELAKNPDLTTEVKYGSFFGGGGLTITW